ncbi:manganese catalase family protein [Aphanomyces euteiches]|nr:manganese catalase family protein [Aphanomyces euteiches]
MNGTASRSQVFEGPSVRADCGHLSAHRVKPKATKPCTTGESLQEQYSSGLNNLELLGSTAKVKLKKFH